MSRGSRVTVVRDRMHFNGAYYAYDLFPERSSARDFKLPIHTNSGVRIRTFMPNTDHARVNTEPYDVPYPIEPTWSALGRHTIGFHVMSCEPGVEVT